MALGLTHPLAEKDTTDIPLGGCRRPVCRADNLTACAGYLEILEALAS